MHYNKATKDGAKFVQNLANMIAWKLSGYHEYLLRNSFVRRVLQRDCSQDPEWCFELGVLTPLKNLHPQPNNPWYIIIDALDECVSDKAEIVNILKSKAHRLPKWMKLIVSSRNLSTIISGLGGFQSVELRSDDDRNREDIDTYLSLKMFSLSQSMVQKIKTSLAILDNDNPSQKMLAWLYSTDGAMGQVMVWFSVMPEFFQIFLKLLSCTFQFEDHILHQLHQTTSTTPTAPNCTHKTTLTTPEYINYTNYTNHTKLHQTTPATPVIAEKFDEWQLS